MTAYRSIRRGITLIEMMVAMALALGIMLILTESFKMALDFVRGAHSTGELISQLNGAGILMTRDLQADHFFDPTNSKVKLSDQRFDQGATPPTDGFFRIVAPAVGVEVTDAQGFNINKPASPSTAAASVFTPADLKGNPTGGHALHFTALVPAGVGGSGFTAKTAKGFYSSEAAEVAYYLVGMNKQTSVGAGGQPLYSLVRRERLVAKTTMEQTALAPVPGEDMGDYASVVATNGTTAYTLADLTNGSKRMPLPNSFPQGTPRYGEDIVVSNVLSFEVLADWTAANPANNSRPFSIPTNTDGPYDFLNGVPAFPNGVFDTGSATVPPPMPVRIKSLQITIRVYDPRVKTTRQNTWKFAM